MAEGTGEQQSLLPAYRVLDLTDESGFLCGKILADLGADVIKIEPPGGDAARMVGPFPDDHPDLSRSLYWCSYNSGKRGITLNLETRQGQALFRRLARSADFIIETYPPGRLDELGISFESLRGLNPRLILISITPFGQSGPYRDYKGSDLIAMAMSGMMSLIGEPGEPPLRVSLPQAPMWAGMYAAAGGLIAHYYREVTGKGQQVDISLQASLLWALANAPAFWATNRTVPTRGGSQITGRSTTGATMRGIFRCKDGYLNFVVYGGAAGRRSNQALVEWLAEEGLATEALLNKDWSCFNIAEATQDEIDEIEGPAAELFLQCTKAEFLEQAYKRGMLGYPVADARDILNDMHLRERDFWRTIYHPQLGQALKLPGGFARFSEATVGPRQPAPGIGEHNAEIYKEELHLTDSELTALQADGVI
ncbi:MAG: CoA transferase [Chloroflexi bacterium]|nr:MAG: CoA transferase [Chloroflexota bacterium]